MTPRWMIHPPGIHPPNISPSNSAQTCHEVRTSRPAPRDILRSTCPLTQHNWRNRRPGVSCAVLRPGPSASLREHWLDALDLFAFLALFVTIYGIYHT
ncbi:hypothetical protein FA13DRAFT_841328 [Coprinellus micaceus]|uniref:Uncharacterized protein n=1 Tax=Coprinellus micaceus TaxID=71717 RepID=A0A4Y7T2P7_COPMI|nr:hypothetical protein FA13DRAFT_841328 [Coprinellus micaceus]